MRYSVPYNYLTRLCLKCGESFSRPWWQDIRFCSIQCANKYRKRPWQDRFWEKVHKTPTCWIWTASTTEFGYGQLLADGKRQDAHRLSWVLHYGPIPEGKCVLHNCPGGDNPACVRPDHLWLGTKKDNAQDALQKGRLACGKTGFAHLHPELMPRGESHYTQLHPEAINRGDQHPWRLHPELIRRGEANHSSKLNPEKVRNIRHRSAAGVRHSILAREHEVSAATITNVVKRKVWAHVE